jgi:uncharacterized membrane protein (DUF4010 family)
MNKRFLKFLTVYGVSVMILWAIFAKVVLPILPDNGFKSSLIIMGYFVTFIVAAIVSISLYEDRVDDDGRL